MDQTGAASDSTRLAIHGKPPVPDDPMGIVTRPSGADPVSTSVNSQTFNIQNNFSIVNGQTQELAEAAQLRAQEADQRRLQAETRCHQLELSAEVEKVRHSEMRTDAIILASKAQQEAQARVDDALKHAELQLENAKMSARTLHAGILVQKFIQYVLRRRPTSRAINGAAKLTQRDTQSGNAMR